MLAMRKELSWSSKPDADRQLLTPLWSPPSSGPGRTDVFRQPIVRCLAKPPECSETAAGAVPPGHCSLNLSLPKLHSTPKQQQWRRRRPSRGTEKGFLQSSSQLFVLTCPNFEWHRQHALKCTEGFPQAFSKSSAYGLGCGFSPSCQLGSLWMHGILAEAQA